ncbi:GNAT family N-acetyltransferase [Paenisporosarcina cavernae]|uniref:N-acetyltransferase n=1 Tax=Paenisporosarcina cavernae TaxID=2320858 RepID=A0A385YX41_9BACL|nr:GNAT family protein [Paenisporosarcina cavernae]AYC30477.1 N-acetyltransferase [Paenisporosarcina cavernae]
MFYCSLTENAYLKLLTPEDAEALFQATDESRAHLKEWLPFIDYTKTSEDSLNFIRSTMKQFSDNNGIQAGIWYDGKLAGVIGFHAVNWSNKSTSLGYWLSNKFTGKGLMTLAVQAMVTHAFHTWKLHRVEIRAAEENVKSRAIPERLGFIKEGVLRDSEWLYDHFVSHVVYAMIAEDWGK